MTAWRGARLGRARVVLVALLVGLLAATTTLPAAAPAGAAPLPPFYQVPDPLPPAAPGTLIASEPLGSVTHATVHRVMYHSRTIAGDDLAVTGLLYLPTAPAPPGGRPIMTFGHGTTGSADQCAPSVADWATEQYADLLARGLVVVATDYEGQGGPGVHPYLLGESAGRSVLDAARLALVFPGAAARNDVLVLGASQGGHAALFANELASTYAPELHLVGTVALEPASHNSLMYAGAAFVGFANAVTIAMGAGFAANYPTLNPHDLYTDAAIARFPLLDQLCMDDFVAAVSDLSKGETVKADLPDVVAWAAAVEASEPGHRRGASPVFLAHGTNDQVVPYTWSVSLATQLCADGETLQFLAYPGFDHDTLPNAAHADMLAWIDGRLAGAPAPVVCPPVVDAVTPNHGPHTGGYHVTIKGRDLSSTSEVAIGQTPVAFTVVDDATLDVAVPSLPVGGTNVHVTTHSGYSALGPGTGFKVDYLAPGSGFLPIDPVRVLDSRTATGGWNGKVLAGYPRAVTVAGTAGVPTDATAVVANLTITGPSAATFLTVYPKGSGAPNTSSLNAGPGQTVANLVTLKVGTGGQVMVANALGSAHVVMDVVGYFSAPGPAGDSYRTIAPTRLLDSRTPIGAWSAPIGAGPASIRSLTVTGVGGVPTSAHAVVVNLTTTNGTAGTFVQAWPSGTPRPNTSSLNAAAGQTVANLAVLRVGANGAIDFYNEAGTTDLVVDVLGYFVTGPGDRFHALAPTRVLDDRIGTGLAGPWTAGTTRELALAGTGAIGITATSVVLNVTATNATEGTFLTLFPGGMPAPATSTLNAGPNQTVANLAIAAITPNGTTAIANERGSIDVVADATGYFAPT